MVFSSQKVGIVNTKRGIRFSTGFLLLMLGMAATLPQQVWSEDSGEKWGARIEAPVCSEPWPEWMGTSRPPAATENLRHLVAEGLDSPMAACVADLDNDGKPDVVVADWGKGTLSWWRNRDGKGQDWERRPLTDHFPGANAVEAVDLDGDGDLDVVGAAYDPGNEVAWWENIRGDGSEWGVHTVALGVDRARAVRAVDLNRDGRPELLVASLGSGLTWWERPTQPGGLWQKHEVAQPAGGVAGISVADLDGDGDVDVAAALPDQGVMWWENVRGNGTEWKERQVATSFEGAEDVRVGDLDANGDLDIVAVASRADRVCWWENGDGKGNVWNQREIQSDFDGAYGVAVADLDGDGDLDVAGVSRFGNTVMWWENSSGKAATWKAYRLEADFTNACAVLTGNLERGGFPGILAVAGGKGTIAWWNASKAAEVPIQSPVIPRDVADKATDSSLSVLAQEAAQKTEGAEAGRQSPVVAQTVTPEKDASFEDVSWDSLVETAQRQVLLDAVIKGGAEVTVEPVAPSVSPMAQTLVPNKGDKEVWIEKKQSSWVPAESMNETPKAEKTVVAASDTQSRGGKPDFSDENRWMPLPQSPWSPGLSENVLKTEKSVVTASSSLSEGIMPDLFDNPFEQNRWMSLGQSPWEPGSAVFVPPATIAESARPVRGSEVTAFKESENAGKALEGQTAKPSGLALTLRDFAGEPGALTRLQVGCRQMKGISGFDVKVAYDPRILSVQRVVGTTFTQNCMLADNGSMAKGELNVTAVSRQALDGQQEEEALFEIEFKVAEDAQPGAVVRSIFLGAKLFDSLMCPVSATVADEAFFRVLPRFMIGDANGDNQVNAADALLALQFSRGIEKMEAKSFLTPSVMDRVDINKDGRVDQVDVRLIQSLAVGMSLNPDTIAAAEKAEAANRARLAQSEKIPPNLPVEPVFPNGGTEHAQVVQTGPDQTLVNPMKEEKTGAGEKSQDPADAVSKSRLEILQMLLEKSQKEQKESLARSGKEGEGDEAASSDKAVSEKPRQKAVRETVSARPAPDRGESEGGKEGGAASVRKPQPLPDDPAPAVPDRLGRIPVPEKVIEMRPERIREVPEQKELPRSRTSEKE